MAKAMVYLSKSKNPYINHAIEMTLFSEYPQYDAILMLYTNEKAVVFGRNQNPWREIDVVKADAENVALLRRHSGGGTVFHDLGNLNFSFITGIHAYDEDRQFALIQQAMQNLGIDLERTPRKDLFYKGKKVSGNAFYLKGKRRMHHGTLLIDSSLDSVGTILMAKNETHLNRFQKIKSVASVSSPVTNLRHYSEGLSVETAINAIVDVFYKQWDYQVDFLSETDLRHAHDKTLDSISETLKSWEWTYGQTPTFDYEPYENQILKVKSGRIISGEALDFALVQHLESQHFRR